ncbi:hypothetical protein LSH36_368g00037 [Paralvinella palmiformis]|uniref:Molybdopterin synthase sulfur carrier subunit n=1 Tax=Paralvinella palmiformis TaxID=53620 RepID=A0AAD9JE48_9ANNE|nr:hypothetical protein LSH36_368g00037 [Paralvinella palmiformis]
MDVINVTILFFAKGRELRGQREDQTAIISQPSGADLYKLVVDKFPCLEPIRDHFALALNEEYIEKSDQIITLSEGDQLAVIPPISGG